MTRGANECSWCHEDTETKPYLVQDHWSLPDIRRELCRKCVKKLGGIWKDG